MLAAMLEVHRSSQVSVNSFYSRGLLLSAIIARSKLCSEEQIVTKPQNGVVSLVHVPCIDAVRENDPHCAETRILLPDPTIRNEIFFGCLQLRAVQCTHA